MAQQYKVVSGDTLSSIAAKYGTTYQEIAKANNIANPNLIYPNQVFTIPDKPGSVPAPVPQAQPQQQQSFQQPQVQSSSQPVQQQQSSGGNTSTASGLQAMGYYGYAGWGDAAAAADFAATGGQGKGGPSSSSSSMSGFNSAQPAIPNFQNIYDTAIAEGTKGYQTQFDTLTQKIQQNELAKNEAVSKIADNPYLSEATMTGRIAKLNSKYNADLQALTGQQNTIQGKITTAKADAQVKLSIAQNQYSIENQQYQQNLQLYSNLLSSGAFVNASAEDIANASISMGVPTSMLQSIITKQKKDQEIKPTLQTVDDGTNQYVVALDEKGNVINKSIIGISKPKAATGEDKLASGNFTNTQLSKAIKILAEADVLENLSDTGDKLLSESEQLQALLKIQAEIVADPILAGQLLEKASIQGGFSDWTG